MYGVKYKVSFKTISDRDSVVILEEKGYTGSVIELTAGGNPFTINTDQSDLLTPIRSSTATLAVVGSDYLQDLYANDPQGIRVKYEEEGDVKWLGYLLPDTFSQDFSSPEFEYDMELVAALSTLKYREFDLTDDFVTFRQIIEKAIEYSGYKVAYLTNSVRTSTGKFYDLKISSSNFYDELGEASTYYEAIEEIAKYLGCCFVPFEDDLYLIDYAAIHKGFNSYTMLDGATASNVTLSDARVVDNYKGTGAKISRIAGKNKAVVNCSLYEVKDILPAFNDEKSTFLEMEETVGEYTQNKELISKKEIRRYYNQPKFDMYRYGYDVMTKTLTQSINHGKLSGDIGSEFVRTAEYDLNDVPSKISFNNELHVRRFGIKAEPANSLNGNSPILTLKSNGKIILHPNVYICIGLQVRICQRFFGVRTNHTMIEKAEEDMVLYVNASLRVGDVYFNGTAWNTTASKFAMPISIKKGSQLNEVFLSLDNNNTFDKGLGDLSGYTFKVPDMVISGECELTLYDFQDSDKVDVFRTFNLAQYNRFRNIEIAYGVPNEQSIYGDWVGENSSNDVLYENVIAEEYIDEAEEIDLKICTNTDGKLALSSVIEGDDFLKTLTSDVYGADLPEHLLLDRVIDTFNKPRFVIDPVLENNAKPYTIFTEPHLNKQFMVAGGEEDVKMESTRYNLIEI